MIGMSVAFRVKKAMWEFSITSKMSRIPEESDPELVDLTYSYPTVGFQPNDD